MRSNKLILFFSTLMCCLVSGQASAIKAELDPNFDPDVSGRVVALTLQDDGKMLVGGDFLMVGGSFQNRLSRINPDGSVDLNGFVVGSGANATVNAIVVQPDNKILVAGAFTAYAGRSDQRVTRLNSNGMKDTDFNPNSNRIIGDTVFSMFRFSSGEVVLGGTLTRYNNIFSPSGMMRLTSVGGYDRAMANTNGSVNVMALQADNKVIVGGDFTNVNGISTSVARLSTAGATDTSFSASPNGPVSSITILRNGKILIGGQFTSVNGIARAGLARLNEDGSVDLGFSASVNGTVYSMVEQADGGLIIAGDFSDVGGVARNNIARLRRGGGLDTSFAVSANDTVRAVKLDENSDLIIAGEFTEVDGEIRNRMARILLSDDGICTPIRTLAGKVAVVCL